MAEKKIIILVLLPLIFLVILRGDVGTDTAAYIELITNIKNHKTVSLDTGFLYLVRGLLFYDTDPRLILSVISLITTILLGYASCLSKRGFIVSVLCIIPIFYLDMTMNGVRYGLSFSLLSIAVANKYKNKNRISIFFSICAVLTHISSLLLFGILLLLSDNKKEFIFWLKLLFGLTLIILIVSGGIGSAGTNDKVIAYSHIKSPSIFSGLIPLMMSLITLWVINIGNKKNGLTISDSKSNSYKHRFYLLLFTIMAAFITAKFTYAGLRVQFLVLYGMFVALQFKPNFGGEFNFEDNKDMMFILFFIGILGVISFLKNSYLSAGQGESPWVPYVLNPNLFSGS